MRGNNLVFIQSDLCRNKLKISHKVLPGSAKDLKIIEVEVEEKPTGEIAAGAGVGTTGRGSYYSHPAEYVNVC